MQQREHIIYCINNLGLLQKMLRLMLLPGEDFELTMMLLKKQLRKFRRLDLEHPSLMLLSIRQFLEKLLRCCIICMCLLLLELLNVPRIPLQVGPVYLYTLLRAIGGHLRASPKVIIIRLLIFGFGSFLIL